MNYEPSDRFDYYLSQAVAQSCGGVAAYYDSIDTADVSLGARLDRIVYRIIRRYERARAHPGAWSTPRRIVACFIITLAILMLFTLSIAALEGGLWNAVVDWYEDHFSLHLEQSSSPPATLPPVNLPAVNTHLLIREPCKPADLPAGWTDEVVEINSYYVDVDLFQGDSYMGYFTQQSKRLGPMAAPHGVTEHHEIKVDGYSADAYFCKNGYRILHWSDSQCYYSLTVYYNSLTLNQMLTMAKSLEVIDAPPPTIIDIRMPTGMQRQVTKTVLQSASYYVDVQYKDRETGRTLAYFSQTIFQGGLYELVGPDNRVYEVVVGDRIGLTFSHYEDTIDDLFWTDGDYVYCLANVGLSNRELLEWAESVLAPSVPGQLNIVYMPQNLPDDLEEVVWIKNSERLEADYSRGDQIVFAYTQELLGQPQTADKREYQGQVVDIHHHYGYARLFADGSITLTWNNGQYRFILESNVLTLQELLAVARDIAPPEEIAQVKGPSGLSPEITQTVVTQNESVIITEYRHGEMLISRFMQTLRWNEDAEYDTGCEITDVSVGAYAGVLLTYPDGRRTVIWNDGSYRYQLESVSMPTEVVLAWAVSVKTLESEQKESSDVEPPTLIKEECKPRKLADGMQEMSTVKTQQSFTVRYQKDGGEVAVFNQRIIDEDTGLGEDAYDTAILVQLNEYGMLLLRSVKGERILFWTDGRYYYEMRSATLSFDDMVLCAKSVAG